MIRIAAILMLLLISGCTSLQTSSDFASQTDLSSLTTFNWLHDVDQPAEDVRLNNKLVRETVRAAVEQSLAAKGYEKVDRDQADFVVAWFGAIEKKIKKENIDHFYAPYGYGTLFRDPALNPGTPRTIQEYEQGTVIVDILDPKDHQLLWRGTGSRQIVEDQPQQTAVKNLTRAVTKILEPFPSR